MSRSIPTPIPIYVALAGVGGHVRGRGHLHMHGGKYKQIANSCKHFGIPANCKVLQIPVNCKLLPIPHEFLQLPRKLHSPAKPCNLHILHMLGRSMLKCVLGFDVGPPLGSVICVCSGNLGHHFFLSWHLNIHVLIALNLLADVPWCRLHVVELGLVPSLVM